MSQLIHTEHAHNVSSVYIYYLNIWYKWHLILVYTV